MITLSTSVADKNSGFAGAGLPDVTVPDTIGAAELGQALCATAERVPPGTKAR